MTFDYVANGSTLFGSKDDTATADEWGVFSGGELTLDSGGITGTVTGSASGTNDDTVTFNGDAGNAGDIIAETGVGLGIGGDQQIGDNQGEALTVSFDQVIAQAEVGLAGFGGNFRTIGEAAWEARLDGAVVASGTLDRPPGNDDSAADNNPFTQVFTIDVADFDLVAGMAVAGFDSIVFTATDTTNDNNRQVNYTVQYIEVNPAIDDSFTYSAIDSDGLVSDSDATVTITGSASNFTPDASNDSGFTVAASGQVVISAASLLANDIDSNGDVLTITGVTATSGGTVNFDAMTGLVTFTSTGPAGTPAVFEYTVDDGNGGTDTATVTIDVVASALLAPGIATDPDFGLPILIAAEETLFATEDADILTGSAGADNFIWTKATVDADNADQVVNFNSSNDTLDLSDLLADGSHTIVGLESSGHLQVQVNDAGGQLVQTIDLNNIAVGTDSAAASLLNDLVTSGTIDDGM